MLATRHQQSEQSEPITKGIINAHQSQLKKDPNPPGPQQSSQASCAWQQQCRNNLQHSIRHDTRVSLANTVKLPLSRRSPHVSISERAASQRLLVPPKGSRHNIISTIHMGPIMKVTSSHLPHNITPPCLTRSHHSALQDHNPTGGPTPATGCHTATAH